MSAQRRTRAKRVATLKAIAVSRSFLGNAQQRVMDEFDQVTSVERTPQVPRRHLLQIFHSSRALETVLKEFTRSCSCLPPPNRQSLGAYLRALATDPASTASALPVGSRVRYQNAIVANRNRYMHEAGAFPVSEAEIGNLLAEMESCISEVLAL